MIHDDFKDLAHEYVFDTLGADERARFEQLLERDGELRTYVDELGALTGDLALLAAPARPSRKSARSDSLCRPSSASRSDSRRGGGSARSG